MISLNCKMVNLGSSCINEKSRCLHVIEREFRLDPAASFHVFRSIWNCSRHRTTMQRNSQQVINASWFRTHTHTHTLPFLFHSCCVCSYFGEITLLLCFSNLLNFVVLWHFFAIPNRNRHQRQKQNNWITLCFNEKKMVQDNNKNTPRPSPESVLHL